MRVASRGRIRRINGFDPGRRSRTATTIHNDRKFLQENISADRRAAAAIRARRHQPEVRELFEFDRRDVEFGDA